MYWDHAGMGAAGLLWMLFNALVLGGLLLAGVLLLWRGIRDPSTAPGTAERLLAERYARGEIDGDEYRRRLDVIRHA